MLLHRRLFYFVMCCLRFAWVYTCVEGNFTFKDVLKVNCCRRVTETLGQKLSNLFPVNAFVAQFGTTLTMILAHPFGVPVSITYCLVS